MNELGERLKELRVAAGLSRKKLADDLQIDVKSVQRYEQGKGIAVDYLAKLATYFDVSADYLLGTKKHIELIEEREKKLIDGSGYNNVYSIYIRCRNNYTIEENATYYWIYRKGKKIGGQTEWVGWADKEYKREVRRLRPVNPKNAIELCANIEEKPMVINNQMEARVFQIYGGQAMVREDICKAYLPEYLEDYIVPCKG